MTEPQTTEDWSQKKIRIVRDALKFASSVCFGDTPEQTKRREEFYEPAINALARLEEYLFILEKKAIRLDEVQERIMTQCR